MKKVNLLPVALLASIALVACGGNPSNPSEEASKPSSEEVSTTTSSEVVKLPNFDKILTPTGAPAAAFYSEGNNKNFETKDPAGVKAALVKDNYGMIVTEFYSGLTDIQNSKSNYRLAKLVTGGNLYLINRKGSDRAPTAEDPVAVFGPGKKNMPVLALKALFPQVKDDNMYNVGMGTDLPPVIMTGKSAKVPEVAEFEFVLVPQPVLFKVSSQEAMKDKIKVISELRTDWATKTNGEQKYIPQAALFVHEKMYAQNTEYFEDQFKKLDERLAKLVDEPATAAKEWNAITPEEEQAGLFGINSKVMMAVQKVKWANGLGYVHPNDAANVDVNKFLTTVGEQPFDNSLFLQR